MANTPASSRVQAASAAEQAATEFASRLLSYVDTEDLGHDLGERLRIVRQGAVEKALARQRDLAAHMRPQLQSSTESANITSYAGVNLGSYAASGAGPGASFGMGEYGKPKGSRSGLSWLEWLTAALLIGATALLLMETPTDSGAYTPSNTVNLERRAVSDAQLLNDPLPPSAYADPAFMEYMKRHIEHQPPDRNLLILTAQQ